MNMGEYQDAIRAIKANYPTENYTILREGLDLAMKALEKQIPKKPYQLMVGADTKVGILNFRKGTKIYNCYDCSECVRYRVLYCPHCGQKLNWD